MKILIPTTLTPAMFGAGTNIPVVDTGAGEVAWVTGSTYAVADRRTDEGYTYECVKIVSGAPANTLKPSTPAAAEYWLKDENAPTNRMAPFDDYLFTKARRTNTLTYVLNPGFITGVALYGLEADAYSYTYKDAPGGTVLASDSGDLYEQAFGLYEYLFGNLQRTEKFTADLPLTPTGELTITLSTTDIADVAAVGFISVGQWYSFLAPNTNLGGTQYGINVTAKDYSYYKQNEDGTYIKKQGRQAKIIQGSAMIAAAFAPSAEAVLRKIIKTAVAVDFSPESKYRHLATVGFVTGTVSSDTWATANINFRIEGNV